MSENKNQPAAEESLLLFKEVLILGFLFCLSSLAGQLVIMFATQLLGLNQLGEVLELVKEGKFLEWLNPLRIILSFNHGFTFIGPAILFAVLYWKGSVKKNLLLKAPRDFSALPMAILFIIAILPFSNIIHYWNLQIPAAYHQESGAALQKAILNMTSPMDLFFNFILVGVMAGVGEELLFRGVLQRLFAVHLKNIHIAIWVTAILFSLIHLEMQAFFPRVLLGAMFGYIAYWSKSLILAIALHLLYNSSQLFLVYIMPEAIEQKVPEPVVYNYLLAAIGLCIAIGIAYWFNRRVREDSDYFISPRS